MPSESMRLAFRADYPRLTPQWQPKRSGVGARSASEDFGFDEGGDTIEENRVSVSGQIL
jgi:hypothetical protein